MSVICYCRDLGLLGCGRFLVPVRQHGKLTISLVFPAIPPAAGNALVPRSRLALLPCKAKFSVPNVRMHSGIERTAASGQDGAGGHGAQLGASVP